MRIYSLLFLSPILFLFSCNESTTKEKPKQSTEVKAKKTEASTPASDEQYIVFFGNSLTAAYGLDPSEGFVSLIQERITEKGLNYKTVNAGNSGETTAGGNGRIDWVLKQQEMAIFVLELGGNDGLRGIDPKESYKNLKSIIEKVKAKNPKTKIVLAGMEAPPNMGDDFTSEFRQMYTRLAKEYDLALIPFLLDGVGGIPELNQKDGIHPTAEAQKILVENIWKVLEGIL